MIRWPGDIPNDRPIDGVDHTDWLLGKQKHSARDSRLVFFNSNFVAIRWRQFKFHMMEYEKKGSLGDSSLQTTLPAAVLRSSIH